MRKFNNKIIQHLKVNFLSLNFIHSRRNWIFIVNCNLLFKHTTWIQYNKKKEKFWALWMNVKKSTRKCHCEKWNTGNLNKTWKKPFLPSFLRWLFCGNGLLLAFCLLMNWFQWKICFLQWDVLSSYIQWSLQDIFEIYGRPAGVDF